MSGVEVSSFDGGHVRFRAADAEAANAVLREASARGTVTRFGTVRHSLHEIFTEVTR